jgi:PPK2 family polyphosphate:nucleotide phosphotransferase
MGFREELRVLPGQVDLVGYDTRATPGWDQADKDAGKEALDLLGPEMADLQERLYANGVEGRDDRRVLLVLQGMDTCGKGGIVKDAAGLMEPQGLHIRSFKKPTEEELSHDFLWRVRNALPAPGMIGVFDRSHYEDVLIGRVHQLAPAEEIERRYGAINDFEAELVDSGFTILKVMLHASKERQAERLLERLDDPTKWWKYNPADLDEREHWDAYMEAYEIALERTNTEVAPWHVVPAHRKWYRKLAVAHLLLETLRTIGLDWPDPDFDVEVERKRLLDSSPGLADGT